MGQRGQLHPGYRVAGVRVTRSSFFVLAQTKMSWRSQLTSQYLR